LLVHNLAMTKPPSKKLDQSSYRKTSFRIPPDLYDEITADAERNGRSMNAEIIARLQTDQLAGILSELADVKTMIRKLLDKS
jgi:predicted HicB family RNase H-like nuclease